MRGRGEGLGPGECRGWVPGVHATCLVARLEGGLGGSEGSVSLFRKLALGLDDAVLVEEPGNAAGAQHLGCIHGEIVGAEDAHLERSTERQEVSV